MRDDTGHERDALDRSIATALQGVSFAPQVPSPGRDEPTDADLLLLLEGKLSDDDETRVEAAVERSLYSSDVLSILRDAMAEADTGPKPVAEPGGLTRLVFAIRGTADQALQFLRGSAMPVPLAPAAATRSTAAPASPHDALYKFEKRFGDWDAVVQVESIAERGIDVWLRLTGREALSSDVRVTLRLGGRMLESVRLTEGIAGFNGLDPGRYELSLTRRDDEIGRVALDFLEA